jgi:hypothetical protein
MKKLLPFFSVLIVLMISLSESYGQALSNTYLIDGTIKRMADGKPLPNVNVSIEGAKYGVSTNQDGYYLLSLPKGTFTIVYSFVGYETRKIIYEVTTKADQQINFDKS